MKIKIMADSTCDLSNEMLEKYDISIAPLVVSIDGKEYRDRIDITADEFYSRLATYAKPPTTSMPTPESYMDCFRKAEEAGHDEILCICMSSGTSGSYQGAVLSKSLYFENHPESKVRIEVIDSVSMSHGSGWLIVKCARLRDLGYSFDELVDYCEHVKYRIKHFLSVEDLENLIRSGRLSGTGAIIGKMLGIQPIMSMKNTKGAVVAKKRGLKQVLNFYVQEFLQRVDYDETDFVIIGYTSDIHRAENLKNLFVEKTGFGGDIYMMQMGVAVGTHVGLGGLSMFFLEKPHADFVQHIKEKLARRIHNQ